MGHQLDEHDSTPQSGVEAPRLSKTEPLQIVLLLLLLCQLTVTHAMPTARVSGEVNFSLCKESKRKVKHLQRIEETVLVVLTFVEATRVAVDVQLKNSVSCPLFQTEFAEFHPFYHLGQRNVHQLQSQTRSTLKKMNPAERGRSWLTSGRQENGHDPSTQSLRKGQSHHENDKIHRLGIAMKADWKASTWDSMRRPPGRGPHTMALYGWPEGDKLDWGQTNHRSNTSEAASR